MPVTAVPTATPPLEPSLEPLAMSVPELAKRTTVHEQTVYRWIAEGRIKAVKWGGRVLIPVGEVRRILNEGF
jgi:excisionase family DNA binding protein